MKKCILYICCIFSLGCNPKNIAYQNIHQALLKNNLFIEFKGYSIIPRGENYYWIILSEPNISFFIKYLGNNDLDRHDREKLINSISRHDSVNSEIQAELIYKHLEKLISFMKEESIISASYVLKDDTKSYFIDFGLSTYEILRYYHFTQEETKEYPDDIKESKWIDPNWVYLRSNHPKNE